MAGHSTLARRPPALAPRRDEHRNYVWGYQQAAPTVINSLTAEHGFTGFCVSQFTQIARPLHYSETMQDDIGMYLVLGMTIIMVAMVWVALF